MQKPRKNSENSREVTPHRSVYYRNRNRSYH